MYLLSCDVDVGFYYVDFIMLLLLSEDFLVTLLSFVKRIIIFFIFQNSVAQVRHRLEPIIKSQQIKSQESPTSTSQEKQHCNKSNIIKSDINVTRK